LEVGGFFSLLVIERRAGLVVLRVTGPGARELFANEVGGHRWQRVPPTEKRGRMQTSTITIAMLDEEAEIEIQIRPEDLIWRACRSPGKGGQNVQKTDSAIQLTHRPTGIQIRAHEERSAHQNRAIALERLRLRLREDLVARTAAERAQARRTQVGSGMRGDKRRTIRAQDDSVVDHVTGRAWKLRDYLRGNW
jgi:peptide chain release factor 1